MSVMLQEASTKADSFSAHLRMFLLLNRTQLPACPLQLRLQAFDLSIGLSRGRVGSCGGRDGAGLGLGRVKRERHGDGQGDGVSKRHNAKSQEADEEDEHPRIDRANGLDRRLLKSGDCHGVSIKTSPARVHSPGIGDRYLLSALISSISLLIWAFRRTTPFPMAPASPATASVP